MPSTLLLFIIKSLGKTISNDSCLGVTVSRLSSCMNPVFLNLTLQSSLYVLYQYWFFSFVFRFMHSFRFIIPVYDDDYHYFR